MYYLLIEQTGLKWIVSALTRFTYDRLGVGRGTN